MIAPAPKAVVIGASAGAIEALNTILPQLPQDFPLPILIVVHLPEAHESKLVELFRSQCAVNVLEAEDKLPIDANTIYFAPPDYHLLVEIGQWLSLSVDPPVNYSRPSIDVLFESAAAAYGNRLVGIILTGANHDGALGLRRIVDAGGQAVVQCPDSAHAPAMPQAALAVTPEAQPMPLGQIVSYLRNLGSSL